MSAHAATFRALHRTASVDAVRAATNLRYAVAMRLTAVLLLALAVSRPAFAAPLLDDTPRTAVISAFAPELSALSAAAADRRTFDVNGTRVIVGKLEGQPVVLFLSGMSMVNAAMTTQAALDRFAVRRIVFSGIAGGSDPALDIGDVVVPAQWRSFQENVLARETASGHYDPPADEYIDGQPFGMAFPRQVEVTRKPGQPERRAWFDADSALLAIAQTSAQGVSLKRCVTDQRCLTKPPKVVVGGHGVSSQSFVDNAAVRAWVFATFQAQVIDMETSAVAQVAYVNGVPFIAFRSLSDLAGGGEGQNQVRTFFQLAADNSATVVRAFLKALPKDPSP
jgi:adenosylhomocysteine nucleosidase